MAYNSDLTVSSLALLRRGICLWAVANVSEARSAFEDCNFSGLNDFEMIVSEASLCVATGRMGSDLLRDTWTG